MKVQYLFKNNKGRDFVCGDIHGSFELLENKLTEVSFDHKKDRLFSVGDIIDRGTDSTLALSYLKKSWFYCVRGNHEQMFLNWIMPEQELSVYTNFYLHIYNGGSWIADYLQTTIKQLSLDIENNIDLNQKYPSLQVWIDALKELPYAIEIKSPTKKIGIIHAEVPTSVKWSALEAELHKHTTANTVLFSRQYIKSRHFIQYHIEGIDEIYSGHTIVQSPIKNGNMHYIDTGAYKSLNLTLIELNKT